MEEKISVDTSKFHLHFLGKPQNLTWSVFFVIILSKFETGTTVAQISKYIHGIINSEII